MVIDNLHFVGVAIAPLEAHAPLVIDADAILARPVARQLLQPIPGRDSQVNELIGSVQDQQLTESGTLEFRRPPPHRTTDRDPLSVPPPEALDHLT
jgi:hypothetical protein